MFLRMTCPVCGKLPAGNPSEKMLPEHHPEPAGLPSWTSVAKGVTILAMILIVILLILSLL